MRRARVIRDLPGAPVTLAGASRLVVWEIVVRKTPASEKCHRYPCPNASSSRGVNWCRVPAGHVVLCRGWFLRLLALPLYLSAACVLTANAARCELPILSRPSAANDSRSKSGLPHGVRERGGRELLQGFRPSRSRAAFSSATAFPNNTRVCASESRPRWTSSSCRRSWSLRCMSLAQQCRIVSGCRLWRILPLRISFVSRVSHAGFSARSGG